MLVLTPFLVLLLCYGIGCAVTAWYLVKWRTGQDLRQLHSGTTGARNAGRVLGKSMFRLVALIDVLRGVLAIWLAARFGLHDWWLMAAGLAVLAGHLWPVQLRFHGGKGVAVGAGVLISLLPWRTAAEWTLVVIVTLLVVWCHRHQRKPYFPNPHE
jgi:glycerol-3-phosphate acyltransferase PlsY